MARRAIDCSRKKKCEDLNEKKLRERERERKRETDRDRERENKWYRGTMFLFGLT